MSKLSLVYAAKDVFLKNDEDVLEDERIYNLTYPQENEIVESTRNDILYSFLEILHDTKNNFFESRFIR